MEQKEREEIIAEMERQQELREKACESYDVEIARLYSLLPKVPRDDRYLIRINEALGQRRRRFPAR